MDSQNPGYDPKHDSAGAKHPNLGAGHAGANPQTGEAYEHAPQGAHSRLDRKDGRNHGDAIADAKRVEQLEQQAQAQHEEAQRHPTALAEAHGNKPSRGAEKDEELVQDDEEILRKMEESKQQSKAAHKH